MAGPNMYDTMAGLRMLEMARPTPAPERLEQDKEACRVLLEKHDALDVAPLLGLAS